MELVHGINSINDRFEIRAELNFLQEFFIDIVARDWRTVLLDRLMKLQV